MRKLWTFLSTLVFILVTYSGAMACQDNRYLDSQQYTVDTEYISDIAVPALHSPTMVESNRAGNNKTALSATVSFNSSAELPERGYIKVMC